MAAATSSIGETTVDSTRTIADILARPRRTAADWVAEMPAGTSTPTADLFAAYHQGIPWTDLFPDGQEETWPSLQAQRECLTCEFLHGRSEVGQMSLEQIRSLDAAGANALLSRLCRKGRLAIEFDSMCALPARLTKRFLADCAHDQPSRHSFGLFIDRIKTVLSEDNPDARYARKTFLSRPTSRSQSHEPYELSRIDHRRVSETCTKKASPSDERLMFVIWNEFESAVSPFDPSPLSTLLQETNPNERFKRTEAFWAERLRTAMHARYARLDSTYDTSTPKKAILKRLAHAAIELETGVPIPIAPNGVEPKAFMSPSVRDLVHSMQGGIALGQVSPWFQLGRDLIHDLEDAYPNEDNAIERLLTLARRDAGDIANEAAAGEQSAHRVRWIEGSLAMWATALNGKASLANPDAVGCIRSIVELGIEAWWSASMVEQTLPKPLQSPDAMINGWARQVKADPRNSINRLSEVLKHLRPDTEDGALQIRTILEEARPLETRPDDPIRQELWIRGFLLAARRALFDAAESASNRKLRQRPEFHRFVEFAVSELGGCEIRFSMAARHTADARVLRWLHEFEAYAEATQELSTEELDMAMQIVTDIEKKTGEDAEAFTQAILEAEPPWEDASDFQDVKNRWVDAAGDKIERLLGQEFDEARERALVSLIDFVISDLMQGEPGPLMDID